MCCDYQQTCYPDSVYNNDGNHCSFCMNTLYSDVWRNDSDFVVFTMCRVCQRIYELFKCCDYQQTCYLDNVYDRDGDAVISRNHKDLNDCSFYTVMSSMSCDCQQHCDPDNIYADNRPGVLIQMFEGPNRGRRRL